MVRCLLALSRAVQKNVPEFTGPFAEYLGRPAPPGQGTLEGGGVVGGAKPTPTPTPSAPPAAPVAAPAPSPQPMAPAAAATTVFEVANKVEEMKITSSPAPSVPSPAKPAVGARGGGYGLDAELARKQQDKYDPELEREVQEWMEAVTGEAFGEGSFASQLRSGERLCRLANALRAGSVGKINSSSLPFKQMENISHFLKAIRALGVAEHDLFEVSN